MTDAERRLVWARGILADPDQHSAARQRRACKMILNHFHHDQHPERLRARQTLADLQPQPKETTP